MSKPSQSPLERILYRLKAGRGDGFHSNRMGRLANKVALITGASRNIGRGIAHAFSAEGARLVLVARSASELVNVAAECKIALPVAADVTDERQVQAAFARACERYGRVDLVINNAATRHTGPIEELTVEG